MPLAKGKRIRVTSHIDESGVEKNYKNGVKKNGEKYSYFKFRDKKKKNGKWENSKFTYLIFTSDGVEVNEKDLMEIKDIKYMCVEQLPSGVTIISVNADVEKIEEDDSQPNPVATFETLPSEQTESINYDDDLPF